jgi:penicillin-binding protein 1C
MFIFRLRRPGGSFEKPLPGPPQNFCLVKKIMSRVAIAVGALGLLLFFAIYLEVKDRIVLVAPMSTPFFEDYQGNYISEGWGSDAPKGYWKVEGELPHRLKEAFLAIEDKRFYQHFGVDWYALARAFLNNFFKGPRRGASTIAMQVARMQSPGKRTYWKKLCEIVIARLLVRKYGREAVFRHYLCLVPQGNRIHGTSYAARRYFRKPMEDLGWAEAALLASLPKAPGRMNLFSFKGFERASQRAKIVLKLLFQQEKIDAETYRVSRRHLAHMTPPVPETRPFHSYHAIMNMENAMRNRGITTFHRPVRTSLDLELQDFLAFVSLDAMSEYRPLGAGNIALMVVERATGEVRGYLGSEYYYDDRNAGAIDYARIPRASGSTLKPFIYALGLMENQYTPSSVLADLPFHIAHPSGQYLVSNYDSYFLGPLLYRKALANSRNTPAVQVIKKVGLEKAHDFFRRIGLERTNNEASHYGLSLAIGGLYVTLQDLVQAYGILANDGRNFSLNWFQWEQMNQTSQNALAVQNKSFWRSRNLFSKRFLAAGGIQILPDDIARQVTLFLSDPMARLPSFSRMGVLEYLFPVAIKTGTSQGFRDAWAVAWSNRYIVGVWIGHPNNDRMKEVNGMAAAKVVKRIMLHLHPEENRGVHETPFALPRGYRAVKICALSGQRATDLCSEVVLEYFKPGTEPMAACSVHRQYPVDRRTGALANIYTPSSEVELKTFVVLPPEYSAWAAGQGYEKPPVDMKSIPRASVEIRSPVDRSQVLLDPETPRKFQTLALKANVTPAVPHIIWIVDGKELEPVSYPYVVRWPLEPGEHTFQARFPHANVQSEVVSISVSEY